MRALWLVVAAACLLGVVFRLYHFKQNYNVVEGDVARDYLVAHHAIRYGEWPLVGPWNSVYGSLRNSPIYYYYISLLLLVSDNIYTPGFINALMQMVGIVALCGVAFMAFGRRAAVLTLFAVVVNPEYKNWTELMWQPFAAFPFYCLSYFLLIASQKRKNFKLLFLSVLFYIFASGLGYYGVILVPGYLWLVYWTLRDVGVSKAKQAFSFVYFFLGIASMYIPVFQEIISRTNPLRIIGQPVYVKSLEQFLINIPSSLNILFRGLFSFDGLMGVFFVRPAVVLSVLLIVIVVCDTSRRGIHYARVMCVYIVQGVIAAALLKGTVYNHYFIGVVGPLVVLWAGAVFHAFDRGGIRRAFAVTALFFSIPLFIPSSFYIRSHIVENNIREMHKGAVVAVARAAEATRVKYGASWLNRFNVIVYVDGFGESSSDGIFWVPLEEMFDAKLTRVTNEGKNFSSLGTGEILFLVCYNYSSYEDAEEKCLNAYVLKNSLYIKQAVVYVSPPYTVYQLVLKKEKEL